MDQQSALVVTQNLPDPAPAAADSWRSYGGRPHGTGPWFQACFGYKYSDNSRRLGVTLVGSKVTRSSGSGSRSSGVHITMSLLGPPVGLEIDAGASSIFSNLSQPVDNRAYPTSVNGGFNQRSSFNTSNIGERLSLSVQCLTRNPEVCREQTSYQPALDGSVPRRFSSVLNVNSSGFSAATRYRSEQDASCDGSLSSGDRRLFPSAFEPALPSSSVPDLSRRRPVAGSSPLIKTTLRPASHTSMMNLHLSASAIPAVLVETVPFHRQVTSMSMDQILAASMEQIVGSSSSQTTDSIKQSPGSQKILELADKQNVEASGGQYKHSRDITVITVDSSEKSRSTGTLPIPVNVNKSLSVSDGRRCLLPDHGKQGATPGFHLHRTHSDQVLSASERSDPLPSRSREVLVARSLEDVLAESLKDLVEEDEPMEGKCTTSYLSVNRTVMPDSQLSDSDTFKPVRLGSGPPPTAIRVSPLSSSSSSSLAKPLAVVPRGQHCSEPALDRFSSAVMDQKPPLANTNNGDFVDVAVKKKVEHTKLSDTDQVSEIMQISYHAPSCLSARVCMSACTYMVHTPVLYF